MSGTLYYASDIYLLKNPYFKQKYLYKLYIAKGYYYAPDNLDII